MVLELIAATFVLESFLSVVGSALRVFFGVLLLQDIFWLGFSKDIVWSDEESLTLRGNTLRTYRI